MTDQEIVDMLGWRAEQRFRARQEQQARRRFVVATLQEVGDFIDERQIRGEAVRHDSHGGHSPSRFASRRAMGWVVGMGAVLAIALAAAIVQIH